MPGNVGGDATFAAEVPLRRPCGGRRATRFREDGAVVCGPGSVATMQPNWTRGWFGLGAELSF